MAAPWGGRGMAAWMRSAGMAACVVSLALFGGATPVGAASPEVLDAKLKALQEEVDALKKEIEKSRKAPTVVAPPAPAPTSGTPPPGEPAPATAPTTAAQPQAPPATTTPWITDFKIGGYGSTRFEASDIDKVGDTFTFRRFVLSGGVVGSRDGIRRGRRRRLLGQIRLPGLRHERRHARREPGDRGARQRRAGNRG